VLDTLANESWRATQAFQTLSGTLVHGCAVLMFSVLLFAISWKLSLVVAGGVLLITWLVRCSTRAIQGVGEQAVQVNAELGACMWDGVAGIRTIHAFLLQQEKRARFAQVSEGVRKSFWRLDLLSGRVGPLSETLYVALILLILAWRLPQTAAISTTLVFLLLLFRLQPNLSQLQGGWVALAGAAGCIDEVALLLSPRQKVSVKSGGRRFEGLTHSITLEAVSFRYEGRPQPALERVTAQIPAGKLTVIGGSSGAGKTTLINLLCRFYDLTEGVIRVDDHSLSEWDLETWRERIALVSQETHLFSTSVYENIAIGRRGATNSEIIEAAQWAHAHEFILHLENGYQTSVGERGARLSGGQRQRIALARAFLRNPSLLILDEATNALDDENDAIIQRHLREYSKGRTTIVITHRLATLLTADHLIWLQDGKVVEEGKPADFSKRENLLQLFAPPPVEEAPPSGEICALL
jgi:subfamily B ATP-binding cassette protein MsbA